MTIDNYVIWASDFNSDELLQEWRWLIPSEWSPIFISKFGDWFFCDAKKSLVFLDLLDGEIVNFGNIEELTIKNGEFLKKYRSQLSVDWVDVCAERHMVLNEMQCFGWKVHPIIGGRFEFANIGVFSLRVYQSLVGQLLRQLKVARKRHQISGFKLDEEK